MNGSRLAFTNGGSTTKTVNDSADAENVLAWTTTPSDDFSKNTLGITFTSFTSGQGSIFVDADIIFNDRDFEWSASGAGNAASVALHEIGHFIGLNHTTDMTTVMFPFDSGLTKLSGDENNAAVALYPGGTKTSPIPIPPSTPPPAAQAAPTAVADASPKSGPPGTSVSFNGTGSSAASPARPIVQFDWDFGDGAHATGATVSHTYMTVGTYTALLTVTDSAKVFGTSMVTVTIGSAATTTPAGWELKNE